MTGLKVLQVNTVCTYGSTGRNAVEIAAQLRRYDVETRICYGQKTSTYADAVRFGLTCEKRLHSFLSRLTGLQGVYSVFGTRALIKQIETFQPDLIHLNNLHGNYLNIPMLFDYIAKQNLPVVYTVHDCWAFTGSCAHYVAAGCTRWKNGCGDCPQKHCYPPSWLSDRSAKMYQIKKRAYDKVNNLILIAVSDWIAGELRQSMLGTREIVRIYNWVDTEVFSPKADAAVLEKYGISSAQKYILGVCGKWSEAKGIQDWMELVKRLPASVSVVLIGKGDAVQIPAELQNRVRLIPYVDDAKTLASFYSGAEVFLNLSEAESFGKTTAEALCCGTPVIVYNTTACPELVGDGCGSVVPLHDVGAAAKAVQTVLQNGKASYSASCRAFGLKNFNKEDNIAAYLEVYQKALEKRR